MPKDRLGNELKAGDIVQLQLGPHLLMGRVVDIRPGGIARVTGTRDGKPHGAITPAETIVVFDYSAVTSPDGQRVDGLQPMCGELTKVEDPGNLTGMCSKSWWDGWKATGSKFLVN